MRLLSQRHASGLRVELDIEPAIDGRLVTALKISRPDHSTRVWRCARASVADVVELLAGLRVGAGWHELEERDER